VDDKAIFNVIFNVKSMLAKRAKL